MTNQKQHGRPITDRDGLGKKITTLRQRRGMTQADLAAAIGVSQPAIASYESGKRDMPLSRLGEIAAALGVDVGVLVNGSPPPRTQ